MKRLLYPFCAIVEQDAMKTALLLNAVDPLIGGVLIRGQKGTGKSTAARSLRELLPDITVAEGCPFNSDPANPFDAEQTKIAGADSARKSAPARRPMPFVELPLNATEDRLAGTLHLETVLQTGQRQFEPGLLAAANRGILYVDEVNLLDDHLVDLLLDAAASGVNVVEREGLSFAHPARFQLIGTMNPEEGELRPQFLDRFGLCVTLDHLSNIASRETIVRHQLAFERDPQQFIRQWTEAQRQVADQIVLARAHLEQVDVPEPLLTLVARLTEELHLPGHRAEITLIKAARAHAAFMEKPRIELEDVQAATPWAVAHRMPSSPLDSPETLRQKIDQAFRALTSGDAKSITQDVTDAVEEAIEPDSDLDEMAENMQVPGAAAAGSILLSWLKKKTVKPSSTPIQA